MTRALPCVVLLLSAACGSSTTGPPGGGDGEPCGDVRCGAGYVCIDGSCLPDTGCDALTCDPGLTCSNGRCVPDGTDADGDGALVGEDCDDTDPFVRPGSQIECTSECGSGLRTCEAGAWTACTAPTECDPPDAGPDPEPDAGPDPEPDAGPDPEPDPCDLCDPEHHVAQANGEPCDCPEQWRVVFAEPFDVPVSQVCRDGNWQTYNLNPTDPDACCAGDFSGCSA